MTAHRYTTETGASMHQRESLPAGSESCLPTSRSRPGRWMMTAMKRRARDCLSAEWRVNERLQHFKIKRRIKRWMKTRLRKVDARLGHIICAQMKREEGLMWISPSSSPRCGCFDSVIISRRHNTDPAAASVWEGRKLEHGLDFPAPAPADATDVRRGQSSGRPGRRGLWRPGCVFYHQPLTYACVLYGLIKLPNRLLRLWVQVLSFFQGRTTHLGKCLWGKKEKLWPPFGPHCKYCICQCMVLGVASYM